MNWRFWQRSPERADPRLTVSDYAQLVSDYFKYGGSYYPLTGLNTTIQGDRESISQDFAGFAAGMFRGNGVVFACMAVRLLLFSEARFQFRQLRGGRPGDLFGTDALLPLERPWPGGTTGDLLARMEVDVSLAGNAFIARRAGNRLKRLRPDWVDIVLGSESGDVGDIDSEAIGYVYWPGGRQPGKEPQILLPEEVAHYAPIPDPLASYRGMSWLTPCIREVLGDRGATDHRIKFFEAGGTDNMVVQTGLQDPKKFQEFVRLFKEHHQEWENAIFLGSGADATVVGTNFKNMDWKAVTGHGETRIAADAGVPPVIVGLSEGLDAATYSNYAQARRRLADGTMSPLWRNAAGSLSRIIPVPNAAELWYDARDIPFLAEDLKDIAEVQRMQAETISTLVTAGFEEETVVDAVTSGDLRRLRHSGLFSVQLQPAGANGNGASPVPAQSQSE